MHAGKALVHPVQRQRGGDGGAHFTTRILRRSIESATATMIIRPCTANLHARRHPHQHHAVREHHDDQHADQRLQHAALTARKRGAADHYGGHRGEEPPVADLRVTEPELRRCQNAAHGIEDPGKGEGGDPDPRHRIPESAASSSPPPSA